MECLEDACVDFLCNEVQLREPQDLLSMARLGDDLGLAAIYEAAATALVQCQWETCMSGLAEMIQMPTYQLKQNSKDELLHHANRGAHTEIHVLELLEQIGMPESEIVDILRVDILQPQEVQVLMRILTTPERTPGHLLAKAVQQHLTPLSMRTKIDWTTCTRFTDIITKPSSATWDVRNDLPETSLTLQLKSYHDEGNLPVMINACSRYNASWLYTPHTGNCATAGLMQSGAYLAPQHDRCLRDLVSNFTLFEVHASAPYFKHFHEVERHLVSRQTSNRPGIDLGSPTYVDDMLKANPGFLGPFVLGVLWSHRSSSYGY